MRCNTRTLNTIGGKMKILPELKNYSEYFPPEHEFDGDGVFFNYIGANSMLIRDRKSSIMIDPYFSRPGRIVGLRYFVKKIEPNPTAVADALKKLGVEKIDAIMLTHTHADHALDAPEVAKQTSATLYGSHSAMLIGKGGGMPNDKLFEVADKTRIDIGDFRITFYESVHLPFPRVARPILNSKTEIDDPLEPPVRIAEYREGGWFKMLIEHPCGTLHISSSGIDSNPAVIKADAVAITIGGLGLRTEKYRELLFEKSILIPQAKTIYMTHWDKMANPLDQKPEFLGRTHMVVNHFIEMASRHKDLSIYLPIPWQTLRLFPPKETRK